MENKIPKIREDYFKIHVFILNCGGVFLKENETLFWQLLTKLYTFIVLVIFVYLFCVIEFMDMMENRGNLENITFNLAYFVSHIMGSYDLRNMHK